MTTKEVEMLMDGGDFIKFIEWMYTQPKTFYPNGSINYPELKVITFLLKLTTGYEIVWN